MLRNGVLSKTIVNVRESTYYNKVTTEVHKLTEVWWIIVPFVHIYIHLSFHLANGQVKKIQISD